jgi:GNAT superfamily N-acetyltransferase
LIVQNRPVSTTQPSATVAIAELDPDQYVAAIPALAGLIVDAVNGGASVNFLAGVTEREAAEWWAARIPDVSAGTISAFVATSFDDPTAGTGERIVGSTLLIRSRNQNSPHRAEIGKVIVHRSARRLGLGRALMTAAEARARDDGRWLLLLDTHSRGVAETFYRSLGWQELGTVPNHAYSVDGRLVPTTFFWKDLRAGDVHREPNGGDSTNVRE